MANIYTSQILKDDTQHVVIKLTGKFDGSGQESNVARVVSNTLSGALATNGYPVANVHGGAANTTLDYYGLSVSRMWYNSYTSTPCDIELFWQATTPETIAVISGNGDYNAAGNWLTISNGTIGADGSTGDIGITTRGMAANTSYTIILELRKHNEYYSRGQFNDPAAFNFTPYGLTPGGVNGIGH